MRLVRYGPPGQERPAALIDGKLLDLGQHVADFDAAFWAAGGAASVDPLVQKAIAAGQWIDPATVRLGPPVPRPGKVVCIGLNYAEHAAESGLAAPAEPAVFLKGSDTVVG